MMNRVTKIGIWAWLWLTAAIGAKAQLSATLKADSTKIEIGDWLHLRLTVNSDSLKHFVKMPLFKDSIGGLEIVKTNAPEVLTTGSRKVIIQDYIVSAYDEGAYYISPIAVPFLDKEKRKDDTLFTGDLLINVTTLAVDTAKPIKPIKPELRVPYLLSEFTYWIIAGLIAIALLVAAIYGYLWYKKKKAQQPSRPKPKDPAHIWAQRELHILQEKKLWQKGEVKNYHSRLSEIMRLYLEYRYDYYAIEATTEEIKERLPKIQIDAATTKDLLAVLELSDLVKFAKMNPAPEQNEAVLANAKSFVKNTIPKEEEQKTVKEKNAK